MTAAIGHPTLRLARAAIGEVTLDRLLPGEWQALDQVEVDRLWHSIFRR
jgi:23S rRNA pseudouridine2457 synthase